jgi:hypothetical protein
LGRYLIPVFGQLPDVPVGFTGTKLPCATLPRTLNAYWIWFSSPLVQVKIGVAPNFALRALVMAVLVYVLLELGVMPAFASHWKRQLMGGKAG